MVRVVITSLVIGADGCLDTILEIDWHRFDQRKSIVTTPTKVNLPKVTSGKGFKAT